jgi:signal transduction histidine kinase
VVDIPGKGRRDEVGQLAGALDALQTTLRERMLLNRAMSEIGGRAELSDVVDVGTRIFAEQLDADEAVIALSDGTSVRVAGTFAGLFPPGQVMAQPTPGGVEMLSPDAFASSVDQLPDGEIKDAVRAAGYGPFLTLPMLSGGDIVGFVSAGRLADRAPFGPDEVRCAEMLAPVISAATNVARLVEDVREANQVKSRFLANMSHELRTPLNAILGFSQVLSAGDFGPLNDRQVRYVGHIATSGNRLLDLINDILDLSKVEAGLLEMRMEKLDLAQLMVAGRSEIDRMAAAKGVNLLYDLAPGIWVWADPRRLQQVVLNLLTNAIKFTPAGGHVTLSTAVSAGRAHVMVDDTGIGIAAEEHDRIFDEFVQADHPASREEKGTGLGLSLSRKLAELMGGTLTVLSEIGAGSRFTVELGISDHLEDNGHGPLVLVVEDESASTELLEAILGEADYRIAAVSNVTQAVNAVQRERPQAILLDVTLPGRDGWSFLQELKSDPTTREIPVVAVTVLDAAPPAYREQLAGFITKPVLRDPLLRLLEELTGAVPMGTVRRAHG